MLSYLFSLVHSGTIPRCVTNLAAALKTSLAFLQGRAFHCCVRLL